ncbi:MAG TPA: tetratricopeptide repeat protein [Micromonosporaceae bacterium]|nr:tetratricopeptide repeat protein [Micromonosporaceae bacterium]
MRSVHGTAVYRDSALDGVSEATTIDDLAQLLRQLHRREARRRGQRELTHRALAARAGWSHGIIGEYLSGRVLAPSDRFDVLVRLLGATPAEQGAMATARDRVDERRRAGPNPGAAPGGGRPPRVVPRQLPPPARQFTGRARQLYTVDATMSGEPGTAAVTTIDGIAGIGKTTLVVHLAHRIADRFPDGQLYVNLRGYDDALPPVRPAEAIRGFLDALQVPRDRVPDTPHAQADLYQRLVARRRILVVLDDARDADQVRPLLPDAPGCRVLVTSRDPIWPLVAADGAHPLTLGAFTAAEAGGLLTGHLGAARVTAEPVAVAELVEVCARLPLSLAIVAARAAARPDASLAALATELRAVSRGGAEAVAGQSLSSDLYAVLAWSYRQLTDPAARLLRLLATHPGPDIATSAAASMAGLTAAEVRPVLAELTLARLTEECAPGRYALHQVVRAYAAGLVADPDRVDAVRRLLDHYLHSAHAAAVLLRPQRHPIQLSPPLARPCAGVTPEAFHTPSAALAWFSLAHPALLGVLHQAVASGADGQACQLAWTLTTYLERRGHWSDLATSQQVALDAATRLGDRPAQARAHGGIGLAHARLGSDQHARPQLTRALDLFADLADATSSAQTHLDLAWTEARQGRYAEALEHARSALGLHRAAGNRAGQVRALTNIGWFQARLGAFEPAIVHCEEALAQFGELGDRAGEAATLHSLAYAHQHLGRYGEAIRCYRTALDRYQEIGERSREADTLALLGGVLQATGDRATARAAWRRALRILDELGHPDAGKVRARLNSVDRALAR